MEKAAGFFSGSIAEKAYVIPGKNIIFTHSQE